MLSPLSAPVLGTATALSIPALWSVWQGTLPLDAGLTRFLVVLIACWLGLSAVGKLWRASASLGTPSGPVSAEVPGAGPGAAAPAPGRARP